MCAQIEKTKDEFSQEQIKLMNETAKQMNTIIQRQPSLKNHEVNITQENGKLILRVNTTDGKEINEKEAGAAIKKAVLKLEGKQFAIAGLALQEEKADAKEFAKVLENKTSQQAIRNLLKDSEIGFTKETSESGGDGKTKGAIASSVYTREQRLAEEKRILESAKLVDPSELSKKQKKEIEEGTKSSVYVDEQEQKWIMLSVSSKTEGFFIKVPHNEEMEAIISEGIESQLNKIKEDPNILNEQLGDKNPFYLKDENLMVKYKNFKGEEQNKILMDKDGKVDKDVFKELFYVYNIVENNTSKAGKEFNKIRQTNDIKITDSQQIRDFLMKGFNDEKTQKINDFYQPAKEAYATKNKNQNMTMDTSALTFGHYYAIKEEKEEKKKEEKKKEEEEKKKEEKEEVMPYPGMSGSRLGENLTLQENLTEEDKKSLVETIKENKE